MQQRTLRWIVLSLLLIVAPAVAADEPAADPGGLPGAACGATSSESYQLFVESLELDPLKNARPAVNECCTVFGCCAHIESGCEPCAQGRKWYSRYSCPGGGSCKISPPNCPTPC